MAGNVTDRLPDGLIERGLRDLLARGRISAFAYLDGARPRWEITFPDGRLAYFERLVVSAFLLGAETAGTDERRDHATATNG